MDYHIDCECGVRIKVSATMAGAQVKCRCGRINNVPRLTELKRAAGQDTFVTNAAEAVARKIATGELPSESCVKCSSPSKDVVTCVVVLERQWVRHDRSWLVTLLMTCAVFCLAPFWIWMSRDVEVHGRDSAIIIPLTICTSCQKTVGHLQDHHVLKKLMLHVEEYRKLFDEYTDATVSLYQTA